MTLCEILDDLTSTSSVKVPQLPQSGHLPIYLGVSYPQF